MQVFNFGGTHLPTQGEDTNSPSGKSLATVGNVTLIFFVPVGNGSLVNCAKVS